MTKEQTAFENLHARLVKERNPLKEYLDRGEVVYLDRHITRLESQVAEYRASRDYYATLAQEQFDTLTILKKLQAQYGRDNNTSD